MPNTQWLYGARLVRDLTTLRHTNADGTDCGTVVSPPPQDSIKPAVGTYVCVCDPVHACCVSPMTTGSVLSTSAQACMGAHRHHSDANCVPAW